MVSAPVLCWATEYLSIEPKGWLEAEHMIVSGEDT